MALERIEFDNPNLGYDAYLAAQHVVRYALLENCVSGKRVLDAACGEGYGAALLSRWGAIDVVGIDNCPAAIAKAESLFHGPGRRFVVGDCENIGLLDLPQNSFDIIVSFETIEHLKNPELFLASLVTLASPSALIVVSCPNDHAYQDSNATHHPGNPYHLRTYTFDEFREVTEARLGSAQQWFLGAPIFGEVNLIVDLDGLDESEATYRSMLELKPLCSASVIPAQVDQTVTWQSCSHFIGVWGASLASNAIVSPQSVPSRLRPWRAIEWQANRIQELQHAISDRLEPDAKSQTELLAALKNDMESKYRPQISELTTKTTSFLKDLALKQTKIRDLEHGVVQLELELRDQKIDQDELRHKLRLCQDANARLEIEKLDAASESGALAQQLAHLATSTQEAIAKLTTDLDQELQKYIRLNELTQQARAESLYHAGQAATATGALNDLRRTVDAQANLKQMWLDPEIDRLNRALADNQHIKETWFEPQLLQREARIQELEKQIERLKDLEKSWPVRAVRRLGRLFARRSSQLPPSD